MLFVPIPFSVQLVPPNVWEGAEASRTNPFIVGGSFNVGTVNALFFFMSCGAAGRFCNGGVNRFQLVLLRMSDSVIA